MNSNRMLIASLLILIGIGAITVSCEKVKGGVRKAQMIVENGCEKDGGDDDDDPIIQGKVRKKNTLVPVDSAYVETLVYGTNALVGAEYTDSSGAFTQQVDTGAFYFRVTIPGTSIPHITDRLYIEKDTEVTILVD